MRMRLLLTALCPLHLCSLVRMELILLVGLLLRILMVYWSQLFSLCNDAVVCVASLRLHQLRMIIISIDFVARTRELTLHLCLFSIVFVSSSNYLLMLNLCWLIVMVSTANLRQLSLTLRSVINLEYRSTRLCTVCFAGRVGRDLSSLSRWLFQVLLKI